MSNNSIFTSSVYAEDDKASVLTNRAGSAANRDFAGLNFGVAISYTQDVGGDDRIDEAIVDGNNIVRVKKENNSIPRIMLETHYYFTPNWRIFEGLNLVNGCSTTEIHDALKTAGDDTDDVRIDTIATLLKYSPGSLKDTNPTVMTTLETCNKRVTWGIGPFVGIQGGTGEVIQALGAGIMIGFKYNELRDDPRSWNLGVGVVVDPNTKVLGDGIKENQALPAGETGVRLKETAQIGFLAILSFSF